MDWSGVNPRIEFANVGIRYLDEHTCQKNDLFSKMNMGKLSIYFDFLSGNIDGCIRTLPFTLS